ncbi:MAG: hypothetical protein IPP17_28705 [Bacteroidetes bacterium]|nr:hypothetical protein [Bacteroidota bacterium]
MVSASIRSVAESPFIPICGVLVYGGRRGGAFEDGAPGAASRIPHLQFPQKTTKSQGMNRIHRKYFPILLLLLLWIAGSFSSCIRLMAERRTTVQSGAIPAEFGQHPGTLLVVKGKGGYNTYLRTNFTAFEGKYALVDSAELKKPEYADLQAYPYCFNFDAETHKTTGSDGKPRELHVRRFYILDRATNTRYPAKMTHILYSKIMKAYIANLNGQI